jgi:hypothetical protein
MLFLIDGLQDIKVLARVIQVSYNHVLYGTTFASSLFNAESIRLFWMDNLTECSRKSLYQFP